ncbi:hypothetical protein TNCV_2124561 [Trichonephila clavipes]|uniref:Uncharacterized protein n=1 Tax=Trichonephila clavipes TaxID=2585209 RepID=A0A8X6UYU8_TRICX|nr:hypothetical protein TNCV_2124561 [Trichonephila clavipes]
MTGVLMGLQWSPPKNRFPITELMTSQQSRSITWESIQDRTIQRLRSKASQPLTYIYPADKEVTSTVLTPISDFKIHRKRGDKD